MVKIAPEKQGATTPQFPFPGENFPQKVMSGAPRTILQKTSKYNNSKPTLVSPEKNSSDHPIPGVYVDTIIRGFGPHADLFQDVLHMPQTATDREIRIAYFRRGREILAEGGVRGLDEAASMNDVSNVVRTRFQAVSMAYEIVSNPSWRESYLKHGLVYHSHRSVEEDCVSVDAPRASSVRWKENVEELVYEQHPEEAIETKKKKKRKNRIRVMVDTSRLDQHLETLDKEAEQSFIPDFWDSLEESLDGLIKMATNSKKKSDASVSSCDTDATPFDEILQDETTHRTETLASDRAICKNGDDDDDDDDESTANASKDSFQQSKAPSPFRPISPQEQSKNGESDLFDLESIASEVQSGFSEVKKMFTANTNLKEKASKKKKQVDMSHEMSEDVFAGLEDVDDNNNSTSRFVMEQPQTIHVNRRLRSESPAGGSVSDLSGSVAVSTTYSRRSTTPTNIVPATEEDFADSSRQKDAYVAPENLKSSNEGEEDDFLEYLMAYIAAIVNEANCADMGAKFAQFNWEDSIFGAFMVEEGQVDGMMHTLETDTVGAIEAVKSFDAIEAVRSFG